MANLNFQQPPRAIAAGSLVGRGAGFGGGGFAPPPLPPPSAPSQAVAPPQPPPPAAQLPPGSGAFSAAHRQQAAIFQQKAFADRRSQIGMPGMTNSNNMVGVRGTLQGVVLGGGAGDGTGAPPLLDPTEFPSLTARGQGDQPHHHSVPPPGSKPYVMFSLPVGMVKQPTAEQSEFTMSSEDFPALPGTSVGGVAVGSAPTLGSQAGSSQLQLEPPLGQQHAVPSSLQHTVDQEKKGIHTFPDGKVTNIPSSMVPNQYGIVGLLTFIRAAESDPELVSLALGQDLTTLGLNLNSPDNLYLTFAGPWAEAPCRPQDIDYHVPPEYLINMSIREKLAPLKLNRYKEDLLFYLFYCFVGDVLQLAAASELYNREWRYHTEEKVWITQAPGVATLEKTTTYERGTYYYFDAHSWRKQTKEFHLDYSKLEGRPQLPAHFHT